MFEIQRRVRNDLGEISGLIAELERELIGTGVVQRDIYQLTLCLDEVLTNIVSYAFPEGGDHTIEVGVRQNDDVATVTVLDNGVEFDLTTALPPTDIRAPLEQRTPGNLGIHLISEFMDEVCYERRGDQNRLEMKKTVSKRVR